MINKKTIISLSVLVGLSILGIGTYSILNTNSVFPVDNNDTLSVRKIYFINCTEELEIPRTNFKLAPLVPLSTIISMQTNDALYVNFITILRSAGTFDTPDGQPLIRVHFAIYLNNTQICSTSIIFIDYPSNPGFIQFSTPFSLQWFDSNINPGIYNLTVWALDYRIHTTNSLYSSSLFAQVYSIT